MSRFSPSPTIHSLRNGNPLTLNSPSASFFSGGLFNGCSPISYPSSPQSTTGETLGALVGASLTVIDDTIYVFAGFDQYTDEVFNKLYKLTYNEQGECKWVRVIYTKGRPPEKRNDHSATLWGKNKLVIFGGSSEEEDEKFYNDISILDLTTMTWEHPTTFGYQPCGRIKHSATIHDNKLYIAGGILPSSNVTDQGKFPNTLLVLDLITWVWQDPIPFVSRSQHITFVYHDRLYLFGGLQEDMTRSNYLSFINLHNLHQSATVTHIDIHSPFVPSPTSQKFLQICGHQLVVVVVEIPSLYNDQPHPPPPPPPPPPPTSSSSSVSASSFSPHSLPSSTTSSSSSSLPISSSGVWTLNLESMQWKYHYCKQFGTQPRNDSNSDPHQQQQWHWISFAMAEHGSTFFLFGTNDELPDEYFSKILRIDLRELGILSIPHPSLGNDLSQLLQLELTKPDFILRSSIHEDIINDNSNNNNNNDNNSHNELYVHQIVLLARWPYFYKKRMEMIQGDQVNLLTINQSLSTLKAFVDYLYKDCLDDDHHPIPTSIVCDLLMMAYEYEMERLFALCFERLYYTMNVNNVSKIYYTAHLTHQKSLQHSSLHYLFDHFGAVSHSEEFRKLPRSIFFQILDEMPKDALILAQQHNINSSNDYTFNNNDNSNHNNTNNNEVNHLQHNNDHNNNNHNNNNNANHHYMNGLIDHHHLTLNQNRITTDEDEVHMET